MSQTSNANSRALRDAFYELSIAQDIPDAKLLDDFVCRYPQFGEELTEFAIAVAIDALGDGRIVEAAEAAIDPSVVSPAVSRAMSHFQNKLHAMASGTALEVKEHARVTEAPNPFLILSRDEFRDLANRLNANSLFVGRLRDREIDPETMTPGFRRRVADELKAPLDVLVAHFAASQVAPTRQFFSAAVKPSLVGAQQSFEQAVKHSGLSEEQQRFLLEL